MGKTDDGHERWFKFLVKRICNQFSEKSKAMVVFCLLGDTDREKHRFV